MPTEDVLLRIEVEGDFGKFRNFLKKNNFDDDEGGFGIKDSDGEQIFAMEIESEDNFTDSGMELFGNKHWSVTNPRTIRDWFARNAKRNGCKLTSFFIKEVSEEMGGIFRYWIWPFPKAVADFFWNGWISPWDEEALCDPSRDAEELNRRKAEYEEDKLNFEKRLAQGEVLGLYIDKDEYIEAVEAEGFDDVVDRFDEALENIMKGKHAACTVYYIELDGDEVQDEDEINFDDDEAGNDEPEPAMGKCPKCGATVEADALFCGECGAKLEKQSTDVKKYKCYVDSRRGFEIARIEYQGQKLDFDDDFSLDDLEDAERPCDFNAWPDSGCFFHLLDNEGNELRTIRLSPDETNDEKISYKNEGTFFDEEHLDGKTYLYAAETLEGLCWETVTFVSKGEFDPSKLVVPFKILEDECGKFKLILPDEIMYDGKKLEMLDCERSSSEGFGQWLLTAEGEFKPVPDNDEEADAETVEPTISKCPKCGATVEADALFCGACGAKLEKNTEDTKPNPEAKAEAFISELPSVELVELVSSIGLYQLKGGKLECCCGSHAFKGMVCLFSGIEPNGKQASTTALLHDLTCSKCGRHLMFSNPIGVGEAGKIMFVKDEQLEELEKALEVLNEEDEEAAYDISRCFVLDLDRKLLVSAGELDIFPFALLNETLNTSGLLFNTILSMDNVVFNVNDSSFSSVELGEAKVDGSASYSAFALKFYNTMGEEKKKNVHLSLKPAACPMTLEKNHFKPVHLDWNYSYAIDNDGEMEEVTPDSHYDDWKNDSQDEINALKQFFEKHPELRKSGVYKSTSSGDDEIKKILSSISSDSIFKAGSLNKKKLFNAMSSYATDVNTDEIILHVDDTVFGGAKEGCIITKNAFYFKGIFAEPGKVRFGNNSKFSMQGKDILLGGKKIFTLSCIDEKEIKMLVALLNALAENSDNS